MVFPFLPEGRGMLIAAPVGPGAANRPEDVRNTALALAHFGYLEGGDPSFEGAPGKGLYRAIQHFQRDHGLKPDRLFGGLTEATALGRRLDERAGIRPSSSGDTLFARRRRREGLAALEPFRRPVSGESFQGSRRKAESMIRFTDPGDYHETLLGSLEGFGEAAVPEVIDFVEQLRERSPDHARILVDRLEGAARERGLDRVPGTGPLAAEPEEKVSAGNEIEAGRLRFSDLTAGLRALAEGEDRDAALEGAPLLEAAGIEPKVPQPPAPAAGVLAAGAPAAGEMFAGGAAGDLLTGGAGGDLIPDPEGERARPASPMDRIVAGAAAVLDPLAETLAQIASPATPLPSGAPGPEPVAVRPATVPNSSSWEMAVYSAERQARHDNLFADLLASSPEDIDRLARRIGANFSDSPEFADEVVDMLRAMHGVGEGRVVSADGARQTLIDWRTDIAGGWDYNAERREDRAAFGDLSMRSDYRAVEVDEEHIGFALAGEATPFLTLPRKPARRLARDVGSYVGRLALLSTWRQGHPDGAALDRALAEIHDPAGGGDVMLIGTAEGGSPEAALALQEAQLLIAEGWDPTAAAALAAPALFPELMTPDILRELLLDALPGIGNLRAAQDAIEDFGKLREAIEKGDWVGAGEAGLFSVLGAIGTVAGLGNLAKALGRTVRIATRRSEEFRAWESRMLLWRFKRQFDRKFDATSVEEYFGDSWPTFTDEQRDYLHAVYPNIVGDAAERHVADVATVAGFRSARKYRERRTEKHKDGDRTVTRRYDDLVDEVMEDFLFVFVRPKKSSDTLKDAVEVKFGSADLRAAQLEADKILKDARKVRNVRYLRLSLDQIPSEILTKKTEELLSRYTNDAGARLFSDAKIKELVRSAVRERRPGGGAFTLFDYLSYIASRIRDYRLE